MNKDYAQNKILKKASMLKSKNLYPFFRSIEETKASSVTIAGRKKIMIGSNNYLGLTHHPKVVEASIKAIKKYGTGCTGSRFLNGNLSIHEELEEKLADYLGHEKALIFGTGMQTNLGALSSVCGPRDCMLFDAENHASLIDASRLALGVTFKYKHNDMNSLEELLKYNTARFNQVIIVSDGVFSMTGEILKLNKIIILAKKYGALVYVDDAHGLGVLGDKGAGTMNHFGLTKEVDLNMGTFSKSFASIGGVVSGDHDIIDYIKHTARSFMFSASMPPSAVACVSTCIDVINEETDLHERLWNNVHFMKKGFEQIGFYTYSSSTPIISIFVGDDIKVMQLTMFLEDQGIFATPVITPAVPKNEALLRTSYMATHTLEDLKKVLEVFEIAKVKFQIPGARN